MVNYNDFLGYAKRGRGECILLLQQNDLTKFESAIKKIVLNNYAFLLHDEFRSAFACELCSFFNNDVLFISKIWNKIIRTKPEDFYTFDYLINNLYFFFNKNKGIDFTTKIKKLLIKCLRKCVFSYNEMMSINSIISLIYDLNLKIDVANIINNHFVEYQNSNFEICNNYSIINKNQCGKKIDLNSVPSINDIINESYDIMCFEKYLPVISNRLCYSDYALIFELINKHDIMTNRMTLLLKIIYFSRYKIGLNESNILISIYSNSDYNQKLVIGNILCSKMNKKYVNDILKKNVSKSLAIRLLIKNYNENFYDFIHKNIHKLKIDYKNSNYWYEIENELIFYFRRKKIDTRLLVDLKLFFERGLSSTSRFETAKILYKYNYLTNNEILNLRYDANYETRDFFNKVILKNSSPK